MGRWDRAEIIRDQVLRRNVEHGVFRHEGRGIVREVIGEGWQALLTTPDFAKGEQFNPKPWRMEDGRCIAPNRIRLWLAGGPMVADINWFRDAIGFRTFSRGKWEHELFGLPPIKVRADVRPNDLSLLAQQPWRAVER